MPLADSRSFPFVPFLEIFFFCFTGIIYGKEGVNNDAPKAHPCARRTERTEEEEEELDCYPSLDP